MEDTVSCVIFKHIFSRVIFPFKKALLIQLEAAQHENIMNLV